MNINNLFNRIKEIARAVKTVRSAYDGDVYTIWNTSEIDYASVVVSLNYAEKRNHLRAYNIILYYGDRLAQNKSNIKSIWDDALNTLQTIINKLQELEEIEYDQYTFRCFEQKFTDMLAGAYIEITLLLPDELGHCDINDIIVPEDELIKRLKEEIERLEAEIDVLNEKDAQLAVLLKDIYYRLTGEIL